MRSPSKQGSDRRTTERRANEERRSDGVRAAATERRVVEQRGIAEAMVDALDDILKWERESERALRVAAESSTSGSDITSN
jgi:hypothetical protein